MIIFKQRFKKSSTRQSSLLIFPLQIIKLSITRHSLYYFNKQDIQGPLKFCCQGQPFLSYQNNVPKRLGQHGLIVTETSLPDYKGTNKIKGP